MVGHHFKAPPVCAPPADFGGAMNKIKLGFFSLSHHSPGGDDRAYLEWHQLDHMPEQYLLPGLLWGQRWASTPACEAVRAVAVDDWAHTAHVVCYLMGNPLDETIDEFFTLGRALAEMGRYSQALPKQYLAGLRLLLAQASPRALISDEAVPYRPNRGIYLIVEEPTEPAVQDAYIQRMHSDVLPTLVAVPGVAGALAFGTTPAIRRDTFSPGSYRITTCYLDDDPATVGERLAPVLEEIWRDAPVRPVLAAPFESMMIWNWERFGPAQG
jgi:hypothetical protein